jgi:hypothetical protein
MRHIAAFVIAAALISPSCGIIKTKILIDEVVTQKEKIDKTENPALSEILKKDLSNRRVCLYGLTVKDITSSSNIDYDYCVRADVNSPRGMVECFIYTSNIRKVSKLVKGKSKIDVRGDFGRFFSLLDNYYTKLEILNSSISIKE